MGEKSLRVILGIQNSARVRNVVNGGAPLTEPRPMLVGGKRVYALRACQNIKIDHSSRN